MDVVLLAINYQHRHRDTFCLLQKHLKTTACIPILILRVLASVILLNEIIFALNFSKYHYSVILLSQDQILQNIHPQFEYYNQYFQMVQNTQY